MCLLPLKKCCIVYIKKQLDRIITFNFLYFKDSWFAQLYDKFRNERRARQDNEVILHKRKASEKGAGASSEPVKKALKRGALHWTPPFPESEDDVSLKRVSAERVVKNKS